MINFIDMNSFIQNGVSQLFPTITNSNFAKNVSATIELPKMRLESRFQLKNVLSRINNGWNHIFSSSINLSRLAQERLLVDDVNHVVSITATTTFVKKLVEICKAVYIF